MTTEEKLKEQLCDDMVDWLIEHGPDGHCDGAEIIAGLVYDKYTTHGHYNELVRRLEESKKDIWSDVDEVDYNKAIDQALTIVKEVYQVKE